MNACRHYLAVAPKIVRPYQLYSVYVTIHRLQFASLQVRAILGDGDQEYASGHVLFTSEGTRDIQMRVR